MVNTNSQKTKQKRGFLNLERVAITHTRYALEVYIKKVEDFLVEDKDRFQKDYAQSGKKIAQLKPPEQELYNLFYENRLYQYKAEFPRILRNSFMVIAISLLESDLARICKRLQDENEIPVSWKELKGSTLDQLKNYYKIAGFSMVEDIENWQELKNFYLVRNCIVHNNGILNDVGNEKALRMYAKKRGLISYDNQSELNLTVQFCINVVNVVEDFTDKLWDMAIKTRPKRNRGV